MGQAKGVNWTDVTVSFNMATKDNDESKSSLSTGGALTLAFLGIMICTGIFGSVVELSKVGDIPDLNYPKLEKEAQFRTVE